MPKYLDKSLCFDDVLLVPQYSEIKSRSECNISTTIAGLVLEVPIISANMDTVTDFEMASKMSELGGLGILHRYADKDRISDSIQKLKSNNHKAVPSIGVSREDISKAQLYSDLGADAICIDIAHGDSILMVEMIKTLKNLIKIPIIAGNVATWEGTKHLLDAGADVIKVGISGGSVCSTRLMTGHGIPTLQSIFDIVSLKKEYDFQMIADGGIKTSGDIVKALAFGADAVMLGGILSGTDECPKINGKTVYRGMASFSAQTDFRGKVNNNCPEGESIEVKPKGSVQAIIEQLMGGIRSGLSYSNARNINELFEKSEFIEISDSYLSGYRFSSKG